jgi:hypothetical protein
MCPVPEFSITGVLPPFVGEPAAAAGRSPYRASMTEVVARFATSQRRREILAGLLDYRDALRTAGVADGVQWFDGSFVEELSGREPNDIDVVTIFAPPSSWSDPIAMRAALVANRALFDPRQSKTTYLCDSYFITLQPGDQLATIALVTYWYGLFSHRRSTQEWKGLVEVPLASDDADAAVALEEVAAS